MSADRFTSIVQAAASACEVLAAAILRGEVGPREETSATLSFVPLTHPERAAAACGYDVVGAAVVAIRSGEFHAEGLQMLAADLRAGIPAMLETGWTKTFAGCP